jgi:hypothetical protein
MRILTDILIVALFCNGWFLLTNGLLLDSLRLWYLDKAKGIERADGEIYWEWGYNPILKFLYNPLFGCVACMASIWGSIVYWTIDSSPVYYPIVIISSIFVNALIKNIYDR